MLALSILMQSHVRTTTSCFQLLPAQAENPERCQQSPSAALRVILSCVKSAQHRPERYPTDPPRCYVRPTSGMMVKPGHQHVDREGLVYLPYLSGWSEHTHSLTDLVVIMCQTFGDDPPVYAKPAAAAQPQYGQPQQYQATQPQYRPPAQPQRQVLLTSDQKKQAIVSNLTARLQGDLQAFYNKIRDDIDEQFENQTVLQAGKDKISGGIQQLKQQKEQLQSSISLISSKQEELDVWLQLNEGTTDTVEVDDIVQPTDTYSKQMYELIAESSAIEDTFYYLEKALQTERITLDVFLKKVRVLARQQFLAKALANKVLETQQRKLSAGAGGY